MKGKVLALALLLTACGRSAAPAASGSDTSKPAALTGGRSSSVNVSAFYSTASAGSAPLWIAKEAGIFQKHGLAVNLQLVQSPRGMSGLMANELQIGLTSAMEALESISTGTDLQLLATLTPVYPYIFEVAASIDTAAELKGQKLGASGANGSDYAAMLSMLPKLGSDSESGVSIMFTGGSSERTAALVSGTVAGILASPPETIAIESKGYHPLANLAFFRMPAGMAILVARRSWIQANEGTVQKIVNSLVQAIAREKSDRAYGEQIMAKYLKLHDRSALDATYDLYVRNTLPNLPEIRAEQLTSATQALAKHNQKVHSIDLPTIIDNSFVQRAAGRSLQ